MSPTDTTEPAPLPEVLAATKASAGRRFLGLTSLGLMGAMMIYLALSQSPEPMWRLFLLVIGAGAIWMAERMRRATSSRIELTETELRDSDGTRIALVADIDGIDRGFFAFKPSNGFLLRTRTGAPRAWRPGLWWRLGRRIGVGGMTPGNQTKVMSEIIAVMLARREGEGDS